MTDTTRTTGAADERRSLAPGTRIGEALLVLKPGRAGPAGLAYDGLRLSDQAAVTIVELFPAGIAARGEDGRVGPVRGWEAELSAAQARALQRAETLDGVRHAAVTGPGVALDALGTTYWARPADADPTLEGWIRDLLRRPSAADLARLFGDLAEGVARLHAAGLAHGALVGAAVHVSDGGRARLVDAMLSDATAEDGRAADVAALARLLYLVVTGREPPPPARDRSLDMRFAASHIAAGDYPEALLEAVDDALELGEGKQPVDAAAWLARFVALAAMLRGAAADAEPSEEAARGPAAAAGTTPAPAASATASVPQASAPRASAEAGPGAPPRRRSALVLPLVAVGLLAVGVGLVALLLGQTPAEPPTGPAVARIDPPPASPAPASPAPPAPAEPAPIVEPAPVVETAPEPVADAPPAVADPSPAEPRVAAREPEPAPTDPSPLAVAPPPPAAPAVVAGRDAPARAPEPAPAPAPAPAPEPEPEPEPVQEPAAAPEPAPEPVAPPAPAADPTPAPAPEAAPEPAAEPAPAPQPTPPPEPPAPSLADVAGASDREALLALLARGADAAAVEARLAALGYVRLTVGATVLHRRPGEAEPWRDCASACPELVLAPAGAVTMTVAIGDSVRTLAFEIPQPLAVGRFEVTRGEFAAFARETGWVAGPGCYARQPAWSLDPGLSWENPGFVQGDDHPAVCISHEDAGAYLGWLSARTGARYRLPTDAEWHYFAAAEGWPTAQDGSDLCRIGNGADRAALAENPGWVAAACDDAFAATAPVGRFAPGPWGVHDLNGNAWEWVETCAPEPRADAPFPPPSCPPGEPRLLRGGSWADAPDLRRLDSRVISAPTIRDRVAGLRVVREP